MKNKIYIKIYEIISYLMFVYIFFDGLYGAIFNEGVIFKLVSLVIEPWPIQPESFLFFNGAFALIVMFATFVLISALYVLTLYINKFFKDKR